MYTPPSDLADSDVADAVARGWGIGVERISYIPVGFGSHHWSASAGSSRWFVTADDLDTKRRDRSETIRMARARLEAALRTARSLSDAGLDFVVAPILSISDEILEPIGERFAVALYPFVEGKTYDFGPHTSSTGRTVVVDRLIELHRATEHASREALLDDLMIPRRGELDAALSEGSTSWDSGPYGERAGQLLLRNAEPLREILDAYDEMAAAVASERHRCVVTHGEPHRANTISTADGVVLIDWDTTLLAPPERDLWMLIDEDPTLADYYRERSGTEIDPVSVRLFRLWWDLCEVSLFIDEFRHPHENTEDSRVAWDGLNRHLDPKRWTANW